MKKILKHLPQSTTFLVLIIPIAYFITGSYFRNLLGNFSLRCFDPEYIYFMSGLTISDGVLKVGHIDNPGTPLQLLVALIFKLVYFIRSTPADYLDDVFTHPDLYLSVVNQTITLLTSLLLLLAGRLTYKYTKNILHALLIQTAPFLPLIWYDIIGRLVPELLMVFPVVAITILIIKNCTTDDRKMQFTDIVLFSLFVALGLSIKLSFIPIWIIPFIFIPKWKNKLIYAGLGILFFFIIAFPVTLQFNIFWRWVKNLLMHSGTYGGGEANIIDFNLFKVNLAQMINLEQRFFIILIVLAITLLIYLAVFRKKSDKKIVNISSAIILTALIQLIMVGKHFAHHYFIPILMFAPLIVFLISTLFQKFHKSKYVAAFASLAIVFYLVWSFNYNQKWLQVKTFAMESDISKRAETWHFAQTLEKDSYKIITSQNYGCPFIEYTLFYSQAWAKNSKKSEYSKVLAKLYPNSYSYFTFSDEMKYWGDKLCIDQIIQSGKKTYLYIENDDENLLDKSLQKIQSEDTVQCIIEKNLLFKNPETREVIYELFLGFQD